jgi:hypothetical protein
MQEARSQLEQQGLLDQFNERGIDAFDPSPLSTFHGLHGRPEITRRQSNSERIQHSAQRAARRNLPSAQHYTSMSPPPVPNPRFHATGAPIAGSQVDGQGGAAPGLDRRSTTDGSNRVRVVPPQPHSPRQMTSWEPPERRENGPFPPRPSAQPGFGRPPANDRMPSIGSVLAGSSNNPGITLSGHSAIPPQPVGVSQPIAGHGTYFAPPTQPSENQASYFPPQEIQVNQVPRDSAAADQIASQTQGLGQRHGSGPSQGSSSATQRPSGSGSGQQQGSDEDAKHPVESPGSGSDDHLLEMKIRRD